MLNEKPEGLEAKVVADADLLEKFGPFGIYQHIRTYGEFNWPIDRLLLRHDQIMTLTLETATGKRLVEPGRQYVADFYQELSDAYEPYKDV